MAWQIARATRRPTGIVALNDLMALGLMAGLRDSGLVVPRDVSIVGVDGHFLAGLSNPGLTTVQLPVPEMARAMVERVMHPQADADSGERDGVFAPTQLVERESVAGPPAWQRPRHWRMSAHRQRRGVLGAHGVQGPGVQAQQP